MFVALLIGRGRLARRPRHPGADDGAALAHHGQRHRHRVHLADDRRDGARGHRRGGRQRRRAGADAPSTSPGTPLRDLTSRVQEVLGDVAARPARGMGRGPGPCAGTTTPPTSVTGCPRLCWRGRDRPREHPVELAAPAAPGPDRLGRLPGAPSRPCAGPSGRWLGIARTLVDAADDADRHPVLSARWLRSLRRRPRRGGRGPSPTSGCGPTWLAGRRGAARRAGPRRRSTRWASRYAARPLDDPRAWPANGALVLEAERLARGPRESNPRPPSHRHWAHPAAARRGRPVVGQLAAAGAGLVGERLPRIIGRCPGRPRPRQRAGGGPDRTAERRRGLSTPVVTATPRSSTPPPDGLPRVGGLALDEPRRRQPHDGHEHRVGHDRGGGVAGEQGVPDAVADQRGQPRRVGVDSSAGTLGWVRAWPTASGPSRRARGRAGGGGTTVADQTVIDSPAPKPSPQRRPATADAVPDARRAATLPSAHEAPRRRRGPAQRRRGGRAAHCDDREARRTDEDPDDLGSVGCSWRTSAAMTTVSPTWAWRTSEARPAGIPTASAV